MNFTDHHLDPNLPFTFPIRWYVKLPYSDWTIPLAIVFFVVLAVADRNHRRFNWLLIALIGSAIAAYYLAQWQLLKLFQPRRYLLYVYLPFFYLALVRFLGLITRKWLLVFSPLILIVVTHRTFLTPSPNNWGLYDFGELATLYETIQRWDQPARIAAPMMVADQIPTFCRQSVFISNEMAHAVYFKNYYDKIKKPLYDVIKGYCTAETDTLKSIIQRYDLDYIVIDQKVLTRNYFPTFQPYQSLADRLTAGKSIEDYALSRLPESVVIPVDERFSILDCRAWLAGEPPQ